jgi:uncharacterized coiled-coil DUF342 family protein
MLFENSEWIEELQDEIAELEKEVRRLEKVIKANLKTMKTVEQAAYIRGYKEGRRTANEGGMN